MFECMWKKEKILGEKERRTNLGGRERA